MGACDDLVVLARTAADCPPGDLHCLSLLTDPVDWWGQYCAPTACVATTCPPNRALKRQGLSNISQGVCVGPADPALPCQWKCLKKVEGSFPATGVCAPLEHPEWNQALQRVQPAADAFNPYVV